MSMATLVYKYPDSEFEVKLLSGSLRQVDECTRTYPDEIALENSYEFRDMIINYQRRSQSYLESNPTAKGHFVVSFIEDNTRSEEVPILFNEDEPVLTKSSYIYGETTLNEVEQSRKLLHSSKNKRFMENCLKKDWFLDTTGYLIEVKPNELSLMRDRGFSPRYVDGQYVVSLQEVFEYAYREEKLGAVRGLFADALEVWKEKIEGLNSDLLYYYCRNLKLAIREYNASLNEIKTVSNVNANVLILIGITMNNGQFEINRRKSQTYLYRDLGFKVKRMDIAA